jgi:hypothetical protein
MAQVVEYLPSKCKALSSNFSTVKLKGRKEGRKQGREEGRKKREGKKE